MNNSNSFTLSSTPLSWFELVRAAQRLFHFSFMRSLPYAVLAMVPLLFLFILGYIFGEENYAGGNWPLYLMAAFLVLCPVVMAPLMYRVHAIAHSRPVTAREALRRGLHCILPCLAGATLYMLAVGIGSVMLLLPGLYLLLALSFWWPALVVNGLSTYQALLASLRLVRGHWWHVCIGFSPLYAVAVCVKAFDVSMVSLPNEIVEGVVTTLISIVVMALLPMFLSANMVVIYHDLTLRRQDAEAH